MIVWAIVAVIIYRAGSRALRRKPAVGPEAIIGSKGRVVSPLEPEGLIRIGAELWRAKTSGGRIDAGTEVTVVEQDGTLLIVRHSD
jgi:membrane protein implicated in regulation of membrane protease activity